MKDAQSKMVLLSEYRAPDWQVEDLELRFELDPAETRVHSRLRVRRVEGSTPGAPLRLHGQELRRVGLAVNGAEPTPGVLTEDDEGLLLTGLPDRAEIRIETATRPEANTVLEGLYVSGGSLCTQCEPEGFRRITYFPDRPDVLARYRVRLEADASRYPVLLANGNRVEAGALPDGRHYAVWEDPFPKPSYLFALVAGDLACESARFVTRSGREVALEVYVEHHNRERCAHALASLARAMRYDEEAFGREYDLDVYMIVAVDDFNMGAMENKGLNLFNAKYVLASPDTATDSDYVHIESVIAHEYFHNWSGNRVTCRDWFQLSLKEGLTVFRDQEFTTDNTLFGVKRIDDVQRLRAFQFPEDTGPLAHPVRPDRYAEINNFYTMTVYEKGAELIRMLRTLVGREVFRQGLDVYFERFDGQAVTTEDFVAVMAEVSGRDLDLFRRWYTQAGTPRVSARSRFDAGTGTLQIDLEQQTSATPGQPHKQPLHIPLRIALFGGDGRRLPGRLGAAPQAREWVLELTGAAQSLELTGVPEAPAAISWLRGFSAPVLLDAGQGTAELAHLVAHDDDAFTRWDAAQSLLRRAVIARVAGGPDAGLEATLTGAMAALLDDPGVEPVLLAALLELPSHRELLESFEQVDPVAVDTTRKAVERAVFAPLAQALQERAPALASVDNGEFTAAAMGQRRLLNQILAMRVVLDADGAVETAARQYRDASSQTLRMGALGALNHCDHPVRDELLEDFERRYRKDPLVLDKWFALEAGSQVPGGFERLDRLLEHPGFRWSNPNRVRAVLGPFMAANHRHFHRPDGEGYRRIGGFIERLDALNPQTAARLVQPLTRWRRLDPPRGQRMRAELERLAGLDGRSRDLTDVIQRALATEQKGNLES
jgi:aminopeptidase N